MIKEWPSDGLERVKNCPICGSEERRNLYSGLTDRVFRCAPGVWTLYQCDQCYSAYLDPRPSQQTIHLAYSEYFTHNSGEEDISYSIPRKFRRMMANGYKNWRYGTNERPASKLGVLAALMSPKNRSIVDGAMRHLEFPKKGQRLLDVGCGNGAFLQLAKSAGWDVVGLDFDPKAVEVARSSGIEVWEGGVESLDEVHSQFDVITLSHVIEHVHNPSQLLSDCHDLLKPGGYIWIETPNINAQGHRVFKDSWTALDAPRHLVIFNQESILLSLKKAGFSETQWQSYRPLYKSMCAASTAISKGLDPYKESMRFNRLCMRKASKYDRDAFSDVSKREFITIKAWK